MVLVLFSLFPQALIQMACPLQCGQEEKLKHSPVWKGIWKERYCADMSPAHTAR